MFLIKRVNANCVELHTGTFVIYIIKIKYKKWIFKIKKSANYAFINGLEVHAGHMVYIINQKKISKIKYISEFNIGHFIISESIFMGLKNSIKNLKKL